MKPQVLPRLSAFWISLPIALAGIAIFALPPASQHYVSWVYRYYDYGKRAEVDNTWSVSKYVKTCPAHYYNIRILSLTPLLTSIPNFISSKEASRLISLGNFSTPSEIGGGTFYDTSVRSSRSFFLDSTEHDTDPVVQCIFARASEFQGYTPRQNFEPLQLVRYRAGDHYELHHDALHAADERGGLRKSSFFVVLKADNVEGGATRFPLIDADSGADGKELRKIIECEEGRVPKAGDGLYAKPVEGTALFWPNLHPDESLIKEVLHAGERVVSGEKIGMNILTWTVPL